MRALVRVSLILGAVLGAIYIIRDYIRDCTRTRVRLLKDELQEEAAPNNEAAQPVQFEAATDSPKKKTA